MVVRPAWQCFISHVTIDGGYMRNKNWKLKQCQSAWMSEIKNGRLALNIYPDGTEHCM